MTGQAVRPDADLARENRGNDQHLGTDRGHGKYRAFERLHDAVSS
jgi:hypothetical protein